MDKERVISAVREYADTYLKAPKWRMQRGRFELASYNRWAADEILRSIEESGSVPPVMVVEDFIRRMDDFSCRNGKGSTIFSVAHDMAENILDILLVTNLDESEGETGNEEAESFADSEGGMVGDVPPQP